MFVNTVYVNEMSGFKRQSKVVLYILYSFESKAKVGELIQREKPDLVFICIIFIITFRNERFISS